MSKPLYETFGNRGTLYRYGCPSSNRIWKAYSERRRVVSVREVPWHEMSDADIAAEYKQRFLAAQEAAEQEEARTWYRETHEGKKQARIENERRLRAIREREERSDLRADARKGLK